MVKSCDDGYPSCRHAEAAGKFCKEGCAAAIEEELRAELERREDMNGKYINRTSTEGRTRARTTTHNANIQWITERIIHLRTQLKGTTS